MIRHWAAAMEDQNPVYTDAAFAAASRFGGIVAPPLMLQTWTMPTPKITGIINATTEWLFAFDDRLSVTVSSADRFNETEREPLARQIWREVSKVAGLDAELPPWQIVKERRATFAATSRHATVLLPVGDSDSARQGKITGLLLRPR
jgi:hypothetical protein